MNDKLKELRLKYDYTQEQIADALNMTRSTYANLEKNPDNIKKFEIEKLCDFYYITPDVFFKEPEKRSYDLKTPEPIIEPLQTEFILNPEKFKATLLYVLQKVGAKPTVGETVLYKLLYFIDFDYYEKYGKSITNMTYIKNTFGPTPDKNDFDSIVLKMIESKELQKTENEFHNHTQKKYLPLIDPDLTKLNAQELYHINEVLNKHSDKTASALSDFSHKDTPWVVSKINKPIDYYYANYRTDITSVVDHLDEL
ncbi:MAG: DUF4065 domain-containing protein [Bifidobacteriaceae bacterium]|jgi:transcriptional regulator with XRE-family HTH domain|nr:DUF4065 domain-containing protein [Bifidobacteriaceae bacterium]